MRKHRKTKKQPKIDPKEQVHPDMDEEVNFDPDNLYNLGLTFHGLDISFSDDDSEL